MRFCDENYKVPLAEKLIKHSSLQALLPFFKMGQPRPLFHLFSVFSNKHYKFLQQIYVKKCPSSKWYRDSNPQPSVRESPPITTRPGLPPSSPAFTVKSLIQVSQLTRWHVYPTDFDPKKSGGFVSST